MPCPCQELSIKIVQIPGTRSDDSCPRFFAPKPESLYMNTHLDSLDAYTVLSVFGHTPRRIRPCIEIIGSHGHEQLEGRHTQIAELCT
jgi:hypothetical protein